MKNLKFTLLFIAILFMPIAATYAVENKTDTGNYIIFKLHSISPQGKQMEVTNDKLYIGVAGNHCELVHNEPISNIDPGVNQITLYTIKGFQKAFSLNGRITCLRFETTYQGEKYTTGDIKLIEKNHKIIALPNEVTWNFTSRNK